jgi:hypothetical protein
MNWDIAIPIILQLIGTVVILAEIILPSMGMLSLIAISLFGYSLYAVFTNVSATAGMTLLVADLISIPLILMMGIKLLARSPATLRPAGMALIDGKRIDVMSRGEYIEKDAQVVVISVRSNQVVVQALVPLDGKATGRLVGYFPAGFFLKEEFNIVFMRFSQGARVPKSWWSIQDHGRQGRYRHCHRQPGVPLSGRRGRNARGAGPDRRRQGQHRAEIQPCRGHRPGRPGTCWKPCR